MKVIIVFVHVIVKIYVMEVFKEKRKTRWNLVYHKNWWFWNFIPFSILVYFVLGIFLNFSLFMTKLRVLVLCFPYFIDNFTTLMTILSSCKFILISCGCMFWWFFFLQWAFWLVCYQKTQVKITFLYSVLHGHVKQYKCICTWDSHKTI